MADDTPTFHTLGDAPPVQAHARLVMGGLPGHAGHSGFADDDHEGYDDDVTGDVTGRLIRPYAMTNGRTGSDGPEIHLESQIQASADASIHFSSFRWEAAKVIGLVSEPMALVEISARLEIPLGVTRVLVADLLAAGSVILHVPAKNQSFTSLLEKVLDGVRNL